MAVHAHSSSALPSMKLQTSLMTTSTRFYERLGSMPSNPADPESVAELVVVALGAFERYYVCWRNQAGHYRQDSYGLPDSLHRWLFPPDGGTRHLQTLQIVFGCGDEFFASDKYGKLENKDTNLREKIPSAESPVEKTERPLLRRSRTLSLVRPSSDPLISPFSPILETPRGYSSPASRRRPQSFAYTAGTLPWERMKPAREANPRSENTAPRFSYVNASVQTDPEPTHSLLSLRDDNSVPSLDSSLSSRSSVADGRTPVAIASPAPNPVVMGRMLDYFNAPKYRLGDALRSTYHHQPMTPEHGLYETWRSVLDRRRTV
ncbi:uncharacterized protein BDZ99DRAFT_264966 [Mytilinidion resinicola]|uniref:Uncharacterized protein n=1 Tax=Mytilinidion resinicola TaxID=574789 RepID=A0A6A6YVD6_9PEZI|nr:uncharacterized protein BDZ99DRAFT_264966 [Mytilinidion resinicola]KAF2812343.1 hypothetical protein BDZ99DRAFT_264966 [Mytilinidion resinicola]